MKQNLQQFDVINIWYGDCLIKLDNVKTETEVENYHFKKID